MKTLIKTAGYVLALMLLFAACKESTPDEVQTYSLGGKVEKGPFVTGSKVTVYELTTTLSPTGRTFVSTIGSDNGSFAFTGVQLVSPYVLLDCDGFYFNEVSGKLSGAQLNLMALVDLRHNKTVNINILTHLERLRVEKLERQGKTFSKAKAQAQEEVLAIFGIDGDLSVPSEQAELCDNNAILLAISAIVQGYRSEAELTELLNILSQNIAETGVLSHAGTKEALANDASLLSAGSIQNALEARYQQLGSQVKAPDCAAYLKQFVEKNPTTISGIVYPAVGKYGINLLSSGESFTFIGNNTGFTGCLAAELPAGRSLRVSIISQCKDVVIPATDTTAAKTITQCSDWAFDALQAGGWTPEAYNETARSRDFTITGPASGNLKVFLNGAGEIQLQMFENNRAIPIRTKTIKWE